MTNWLIIFNGKVINIIEKDGNINDDDLTATWDTIAQDDSKKFKIGDEFTSELQLQYNHDIWLDKGWVSDVVTKPPKIK
jgi:hypothetical protein